MTMMKRTVRWLTLILIFCLCPIYADEALKVAHLVYPNSRSETLGKGVHLNVESRELLVKSFVVKLSSCPVKEFQGVWQDGGFPIVLVDEKMNPIKAYKIYNFPDSKGVFIEFEVKKNENGFELGKMKLPSEFKAKQWTGLSEWLTQENFPKLATAMEK